MIPVSLLVCMAGMLTRIINIALKTFDEHYIIFTSLLRTLVNKTHHIATFHELTQSGLPCASAPENECPAPIRVEDRLRGYSPAPRGRRASHES